MARIFSEEYKQELIQKLPRDLRELAAEFRSRYVEFPDHLIRMGVIDDAQLAAFYSLVYIAMAKHPNNVTSIRSGSVIECRPVDSIDTDDQQALSDADLVESLFHLAPLCTPSGRDVLDRAARRLRELTA